MTLNSNLCRLFVIFVLLSGCSLKVNRDVFEPGSILVMPPTNAVQGGKPHPVAADSGSYFQGAIVSKFYNDVRFPTTAYAVDETFSYEIPSSIADAIAAARAKGASYCLISRLGEFRDAFPMTFRDDYVVLQEARLINVNTNKDVWATVAPFRASGTNIGSHYPLLNELAGKIYKSVIQNNVQAGQPALLQSHNSTPIQVAEERPVMPVVSTVGDGVVPQNLETAKKAPAPSRAVASNGCDVEQILRMKKLQLTDEQVQAACKVKRWKYRRFRYSAKRARAESLPPSFCPISLAL